MQEEYADLISSLQRLSESRTASANRQKKIQPFLLHRAKLCRDRQGSPGEFESVVQGSREQQTIGSSAESQAPDLFAVDGDVLAALQVGQAHHLNTTTCQKKGKADYWEAAYAQNWLFYARTTKSVLKPVVGWIHKLFALLGKNCHKLFFNSNGNKAKSLRIPDSKSKLSTSATILVRRPAAL